MYPGQKLPLFWYTLFSENPELTDDRCTLCGSNRPAFRRRRLCTCRAFGQKNGRRQKNHGKIGIGLPGLPTSSGKHDDEDDEDDEDEDDDDDDDEDEDDEEFRLLMVTNHSPFFGA